MKLQLIPILAIDTTLTMNRLYALAALFALACMAAASPIEQRDNSLVEKSEIDTRHDAAYLIVKEN